MNKTAPNYKDKTMATKKSDFKNLNAIYHIVNPSPEQYNDDYFVRTSPTYGYSNHYDYGTKTAKDMDNWLKRSRFELSGWDKK
jgi:hypothetical protein